jgi:hypothetical protein
VPTHALTEAAIIDASRLRVVRVCTAPYPYAG